jgi:hypothetical protein
VNIFTKVRKDKKWHEWDTVIRGPGGRHFMKKSGVENFVKLLETSKITLFTYFKDFPQEQRCYCSIEGRYGYVS